MSRPIAPLALVACAALPTAPAVAHGVAGAHMFVSTLIIDDRNVADEAILPTFRLLLFCPNRPAADPRQGCMASTPSSISGSPRISVLPSTGLQLADPAGRKDRDRLVELRHHAEIQAVCELRTRVHGVGRRAAAVSPQRANGTNGAVFATDDSSSTTPLIYFVKGFGDLPIGWVRPLGCRLKTEQRRRSAPPAA